MENYRSGENSLNKFTIPGLARIGKSGVKILKNLLVPGLALFRFFLSVGKSLNNRVVPGLALVGKASIVSCFCTIFIYSSEIFPTLIRAVGVGSCTFFGRVGSLLAPQVR